MCVCVLSHFSSVWLFVILIDCRPPGSSIMGFSRKGCWSGLPCPPPGDLPDPGIKLASLMSPTLARGFFTTNTTYACVHAKLLQLFPTLCHPMDYIHKTISFFFFFFSMLCGMWNLSYSTRDWTSPLAVETWNLNHWTAGGESVSHSFVFNSLQPHGL